MNSILFRLIGGLILLLMVSGVQAAFIQTFQQTGTLGLEMSAVGIAGAPAVSSASSGTLNISTQASLGVPTQAYLYALDANHPGTMTASFNGAPVPGGPIGPYASDSAFTMLYTWRWDVTTLMVNGTTNYSWGFSEMQDQFGVQGNNISLAALVLVYSDATLPSATATIVDGMIYVGNTNPENRVVQYFKSAGRFQPDQYADLFR